MADSGHPETPKGHTGGRWPGVGTQHETLRQKYSEEGEINSAATKLSRRRPSETPPKLLLVPLPGGVGPPARPNPERRAPFAPRALAIRQPPPGPLQPRGAPCLFPEREKRMGPPGAGQRAPRSAHLSSPAPGLRRPTRHLSPALPAHTLRTPAAPRALPPPTLRLPPLPAGAAPASQGVGAPRGSAATRALGVCGP
ncbi:atherin-like [Dama dama]|uniref:atherin-like n=1 Tax=Dama dama TaxID=30532 RepID=UPI002A368BA4|nr:atherin-like [Dama dama]